MWILLICVELGDRKKTGGDGDGDRETEDWRIGGSEDWGWRW